MLMVPGEAVIGRRLSSKIEPSSYALETFWCQCRSYHSIGILLRPDARQQATGWLNCKLPEKMGSPPLYPFLTFMSIISRRKTWRIALRNWDEGKPQNFKVISRGVV